MTDSISSHKLYIYHLINSWFSIIWSVRNQINWELENSNLIDHHSFVAPNLSFNRFPYICMNSIYCLTKCKLLSLTANFQTVHGTPQPAFGVCVYPIQKDIQNQPLGHCFYFSYQLFHRDDHCRIWELYKHEDVYTFLNIRCPRSTARK